jgi:hypothetical protein
MHLLKRCEAIRLADYTYVIINANNEIKPWGFQTMGVSKICKN